MRALSYSDAKKLLVKLATIHDEVVLIGGQALNFWAERYLGRAPELAEFRPFTSKDVDFCGSPHAVQASAELLGGRAKLAEPFEPVPNTGVVVFVDETGSPQQIDFLKAPFGIDHRELFELRVVMRVETEDGRAVPFSVMQPLLCLESRAHNVAGLPGYQDEKSLRQLRSAIVCAREYIREILADGHDRAALRLNERAFRFALRSRSARVVRRDHGVELFEAVLEDHRLPERFLQLRLPQMRTAIRRQKATPGGRP